MSRAMALLALLLLPALGGCDDHASFLPVDLLEPDDDDTAVDDDDATVADDDDTTVADDDDVTPPPAKLGATYCLDWWSVDITEPPGIWEYLVEIGVALDSSPPVLVPTAVDAGLGRIWIDVGLADDGCIPDTASGTEPLDGADGGLYAPPHFESGPGTMLLSGSAIPLPLQDAVITGDFSPSADRITEGTITGALDLSSAFGACALLSCTPCPDGGDQCVGFAAESAVWNRAD